MKQSVVIAFCVAIAGFAVAVSAVEKSADAKADGEKPAVCTATCTVTTNKVTGVVTTNKVVNAETEKAEPAKTE